MTQLWAWQTGAVEFSTDPWKTHGCIYDMGMGTGKSLCVIETAKRLRSRRMLIVGPKATVSENAWGKQFRQHGDPNLQWLLLNKGSAAKKAEQVKASLRKADAHGVPCAHVINYESLWIKGFAPTALTAGYDLVVFDESHKIKGPRSKASLFAHKLARSVRGKGGRSLLLTGTLMPHSPLDIWAQMRALNPDEFGMSFTRFRARYAVMGGFENRQVLKYVNMDELQDRLRPYIYRVSADVLQFDDPLVTTVTVDLPPAAKRAYLSMERDLVAEVGAGVVTAANGLVKLLRLQQFTSGYMKLDDDAEVTEMHSAKEDALKEIFEGTMQEPVVIFGQFVGDLLTTKRAAEKTGRGYYELSGRINELDDWDRVARASGSPAPVIGVQIASGGTGIDLTAAGIAVYLSTGFNGGNFLQSQARIDRPGRKPIVRYIYVEAAGSVDELVRRGRASRKTLVASVLDALTAQNS